MTTLEPVVTAKTRSLRVADAFAPKKNLTALFVRPNDNFAPLDGIRGLFTMWVIAAHCVFALGPAKFRQAIAEHPALRWPFLAHYAIDTFFVMSGFLIAHLIMREHQSTGAFSLRTFFLRRAFRLLPAYFAALCLCLVVESTNANNVIWNLLYINNFLPFLEQFMPWTWSLAVEEQFYLTLPIVLMVMFKLKRLRGAYLAGFIAVAAIVRLVIVRTNNFGPPMEGIGQALIIGDLLYTKTYSRFGALACGVLIAYLYHYRRPPLEWLDRSPRAALLLSAVAASVIVALFMPGAPCDMQLFQFGNAWPDWLIPIGLALNRYAFDIAFSLLLVLMLGASPLGRALGKVLALEVWYPFAQLSYSAYLFHPLIVRFVVGRFGSRLQTDYGSTIIVFAISAVLTYAFAFVVYMAVERPGMNMRRLLRSATSPDPAAPILDRKVVL